MLSVIMLNVVMLSVVVPQQCDKMIKKNPVLEKVAKNSGSTKKA